MHRAEHHAISRASCMRRTFGITYSAVVFASFVVIWSVLDYVLDPYGSVGLFGDNNPMLQLAAMCPRGSRVLCAVCQQCTGAQSFRRRQL